MALFHYVDDVLLTSDSLSDLEQVAPSCLRHLKSHGWAVNEEKVQGPGLSVKFLGVICLSKTKVITEAIVDNIQAFPRPTKVTQLQAYLGLLGYWRVFVPHLAQVARPLYSMVRKGALWNWTEATEQAFVASKRAVQQAQALQVVDPSRLDVHVTQKGYGWGL